MRLRYFGLTLLFSFLFSVLHKNPSKFGSGSTRHKTLTSFPLQRRLLRIISKTQFNGAIEVETFLPTEYRGLIEAMRSGNLDFAFFPPDGYVIPTATRVRKFS